MWKQPMWVKNVYMPISIQRIIQWYHIDTYYYFYLCATQHLYHLLPPSPLPPPLLSPQPLPSPLSLLLPVAAAAPVAHCGHCSCRRHHRSCHSRRSSWPSLLWPVEACSGCLSPSVLSQPSLLLPVTAVAPVACLCRRFCPVAVIAPVAVVAPVPVVDSFYLCCCPSPSVF